jgi:hypothetical protein
VTSPPPAATEFCPKKRASRDRCKFLSIKAKAGIERASKNVLTEKRGLFLGVLAGKQGFGAKKTSLYFALFHVLVVFCVGKSLTGRTFPKIEAFKKNRAEKPTIGFWFSAGSGNIVARKCLEWRSPESFRVCV